MYLDLFKPNYNSFIATFCHNSLNGNTNIVNDNKKIPLIYIDNLINKIIQKLSQEHTTEILIKEDTKLEVKYVKKLIDKFNETYITNFNIPKLDTQFKSNLFNTFHSYIDIESYFPINHSLKPDERGSFSESIDPVLQVKFLSQIQIQIMKEKSFSYSKS